MHHKQFIFKIIALYPAVFSEYSLSLQNTFSDTHTLLEIRYRLSSYISYFSFYYHHTPFVFDILLILPLAGLEPFYEKHLALYITPECLEDPDTLPLIYCVASHCFWQDGKWIPLELYKTGAACLQEKSA